MGLGSWPSRGVVVGLRPSRPWVVVWVCVGRFRLMGPCGLWPGRLPTRSEGRSSADLALATPRSLLSLVLSRLLVSPLARFSRLLSPVRLWRLSRALRASSCHGVVTRTRHVLSRLLSPASRGSLRRRTYGVCLARIAPYRGPRLGCASRPARGGAGPASPRPRPNPVQGAPSKRVSPFYYLSPHKAARH